MTRTWVIQRIDITGDLVCFYTPHTWSAAASFGMLLFTAALAEAARRDAIPWWVPLPALLLTLFMAAALLHAYRINPKGTVHFQVDHTGITLGGFAFRFPVSVHFTAVRRVLIGDRFEDLAAPVLFELQPAATAEPHLRPHLAPDAPSSQTWVIRSYHGMDRSSFTQVLQRLLPTSIPLTPFKVCDQPAPWGQLPGAPPRTPIL